MVSSLPDESSDSDEDNIYADEDHWEPDAPAHAELPPDVFVNPNLRDSQEPPAMAEVFSSEQRRDMEEALRRPAQTVPFPVQTAGKPVPNRNTQSAGYAHYSRLFRGRNPWLPFQSHIDWAIAWWAKLRGPGSNAFTELLKIEGVRCMVCIVGFDSYMHRCLRLLGCPIEILLS